MWVLRMRPLKQSRQCYLTSPEPQSHTACKIMSWYFHVQNRLDLCLEASHHATFALKPCDSSSSAKACSVCFRHTNGPSNFIVPLHLCCSAARRTPHVVRAATISHFIDWSKENESNTFFVFNKTVWQVPMPQHLLLDPRVVCQILVLWIITKWILPDDEYFFLAACQIKRADVRQFGP